MYYFELVYLHLQQIVLMHELRQQLNTIDEVDQMIRLYPLSLIFVTLGF